MCRAYPNAALAVRLLKQIAAKHPDLILQGMGSGVEAASAFQARLRKAAPSGAPLEGAEAAVAAGFSWIYLDILSVSKMARASLLHALVKRFQVGKELLFGPCVKIRDF